ncbi:MAG: substrate-binding domain-containing protein [Actinobacteria bacterium]|nr:substrate-binding domain-containing protein [Actinomycetota bacterium]
MPTLFDRTRKPLARSPLVLVVWKERGAALSARCGGPVNWKCLGDAAAAGPWTASGGRPEWGPVKPGYGDPETDGVGLLVLGQAVAGYFGRSDLSTADLDDDAFARWFGALGDAVPPSGTSPLDLMLSLGPAAYDATGTTEAEAGPLLEDSPGRAPLDLLYPSPMVTADVSLATTGTGPSPALLGRLTGGEAGRRALAGGGWRVPEERNIEGVPDSPPLPPTTGLPPAGLLDNLRGRWREVTGR